MSNSIINGYFGVDGEDSQLTNGFASMDMAQDDLDEYYGPDCWVEEISGKFWIAYS